jgi:hypothetical protein
MKLYSIYSKAMHDNDTIHHLKSDDRENEINVPQNMHGGRIKYVKNKQQFKFFTFYPTIDL